MVKSKFSYLCAPAIFAASFGLCFQGCSDTPSSASNGEEVIPIPTEPIHVVEEEKVQVQLNDEIEDKEEFWAKFKHGVNEFKAQLPRGVVAVVVLDDFGDSSALLVTMESDDKTYRQLSDYMDQLKDCLRRVEAVGRMTVTGMQKD